MKSHYEMQRETEQHIRDNPELRRVLTEFVFLKVELDRPPTYEELTDRIGELATGDQQ